MGVTLLSEEDAAADLIRERAEERAAAALERAAETLNAARPYAGGADGFEAMARERDAASGQHRPAPSRPMPAPPATLADEDAAPVRKGVLLMLLQGVIVREREHAAQIIADLERRVAALESRAAGGANRKGKRK